MALSNLHCSVTKGFITELGIEYEQIGRRY